MEGCTGGRTGGSKSRLNVSFRLLTGRVSAGTEGMVIAAGRVMVTDAQTSVTHRASYWRHRSFLFEPYDAASITLHIC